MAVDKTPKTRNELGQFLPRDNEDAAIGTVLAEAAETRRQAEETAAEKEALKPRGRETKAKPSPNIKIEGAAAEFFDDMIPPEEVEAEKAKAKEAEKKKDDGKKEKPKADKEKEKEKPKEKPVAKTPPRRAEPQGMTPEQIASLAAETAARITGVKKTEEPAKEAGPELSASEQRKLVVLKHMETLYGDKYKGLSKKYVDGQAKVKAYAAQWEKDHPGQEFDEAADEHQEYFEKNDLFESWEQDEFDEARLDILAERRAKTLTEERNKEINAKLSKLERSEKLRDSVPQIHGEQMQAAKWIWKEFGDDFAEVMTESGFNKEKAAELAKSDPVGYSYRLAAAKDLDTEAEEVYKLFNGLVDYNSKNPVHVAMSDFAERMEQALDKAPLEDKTDSEGRTFLPNEKFYKLPLAERENHWTLQARDVIFKRAKVLARETGDKIKIEEEKLTRFAEAKGWKEREKGAEDDDKRKEAESGEEEEQLEEEGEKPRSPSSSAESKMAALKNNEAKAGKNSQKNWYDDL